MLAGAKSQPCGSAGDTRWALGPLDPPGIHEDIPGGPNERRLIFVVRVGSHGGGIFLVAPLRNDGGPTERWCPREELGSPTEERRWCHRKMKSHREMVEALLRNGGGATGKRHHGTALG